MIKRTGIIALGLAVALSSAASKAQQQAPTTELEGRWEGVSSITNGGPLFPLKAGLVVLTFTGNKLAALHLMPVSWVPFSDKATDLDFSIDPRTSPKQIDYWLKPDKKMRAVYEVNGDELRLGVPEVGEHCGLNPPRPSVVGGAEGTCAVLLTLKKRPEPK